MARKIIILEQVGATGDFNVAFWLDVPAARQRFYASATAASAFLDATAPETAALQSGVVTEVVEKIYRPNGQSAAQLRAALVARHTELQAFVTSNNPWNRYGTSHDGTIWTAVTVA